MFSVVVIDLLELDGASFIGVKLIVNFAELVAWPSLKVYAMTGTAPAKFATGVKLYAPVD